MMVARRIGAHNEVKTTAARAVSSGHLHETGDGRVGVYWGSQDVASGEPLTLHVEETIEIDFANAAAQVAGEEVDFDFANQQGVALGDAAGDAIIGKLIVDKALNATKAQVNLNAQIPDIDGQVVLANLPTADPTIAGALWNNTGVVNVSAG